MRSSSVVIPPFKHVYLDPVVSSVYQGSPSLDDLDSSRISSFKSYEASLPAVQSSLSTDLLKPTEETSRPSKKSEPIPGCREETIKGGWRPL